MLSWNEPIFVAAAGLAVATLAGLVVGLERERAAAADARPRYAGVRTLALAGLLGGLAGLLGEVWGVAAPIAALLSVGALSVVAAWQTREHPGVTTEVAAVLVVALGVVATTRLPGIAPAARLGLVGAASLVVTGLLSLRGPLHQLARAVSRDEMLEVAQLGLLLLVALPLLPDIHLGPIKGLNPYEIGLMVALIAGIGLAGYLAVRVLGAGRGMALAGFLGGLVSSTAVTLGLAGQVKVRPELSRAAGRGIVLACVVMLPRQLLEVGVVAPSLLRKAAVPLAVMTAVGAVGALVTLLRDADPPAATEDRLQNPGSMREALKFGALYAVIVVVSGFALRWLGPEGLYVSSVLAGIADVDAITLSVGRLVGEGLDHRVAVRALTLAAITNTSVKMGMAWIVGGRQLGVAVLAGLGPMLLTGGLLAVFLP